MFKQLRRWQQAFASLLLAAAYSHVAAGEIHIGQVTPLTGPVSIEGISANIGIKIAVSSLNAQGGLSGQRIVFRTENDEYQPEKTVALIRQLAKTGTLALLVPVGSPSMTKVLKEKVLEQTGMPVIGVVPGAEPLRNPHNPYLYHIRAGDVEQYSSMVRNALTIGLNRIAVVYADIPFGHAGVATMTTKLKEAKLEPLATLPISVAAGASHADTINKIKTANPNLVVLISPGQIAGEFVSAYRAHGMTTQITTLSYGHPEVLCNTASAQGARGVSVAQVFPNIQNTTIPLVRQFQDDYRAWGPKDVKPSALHFEGYVAAKVLFEGIRRISGPPTREKLIKALDSMQSADLGGYIVDFSPSKHTGSIFVDIGVITKDCKVLS